MMIFLFDLKQKMLSILRSWGDQGSNHLLSHVSYVHQFYEAFGPPTQGLARKFEKFMFFGAARLNIHKNADFKL